MVTAERSESLAGELCRLHSGGQMNQSHLNLTVGTGRWCRRVVKLGRLTDGRAQRRLWHIDWPERARFLPVMPSRCSGRGHEIEAPVHGRSLLDVC